MPTGRAQVLDRGPEVVGLHRGPALPRLGVGALAVRRESVGPGGEPRSVAPGYVLRLPTGLGQLARELAHRLEKPEARHGPRGRGALDEVALDQVDQHTRRRRADVVRAHLQSRVEAAAPRKTDRRSRTRRWTGSSRSTLHEIAVRSVLAAGCPAPAIGDVQRLPQLGASTGRPEHGTQGAAISRARGSPSRLRTRLRTSSAWSAVRTKPGSTRPTRSDEQPHRRVAAQPSKSPSTSLARAAGRRGTAARQGRGAVRVT